MTAVLVVLIGLFGAGSALACSCARTSPAEALAGSDAAVAARLVGIEPMGPVRAAYRYEVLHVYRGRDRFDPGSTLVVASSTGSAACGLPEAVGRHFGLFLLADGRGWYSGLCGVIAPRRLWAAARGGAPGAQRAGFGCTS